MRVVSVLPSATEIVCALGHGSDLVGRSAECDYPAGVRALPVVMRAREADGALDSAAIDARVAATRGRGESLYTIDVDLLRSLRPDVILTQDLCGVCSVTGVEMEEACARAGVSPRVVSLTPRTLEEVWASIGTVSAAIGDVESGRRLTEELRARSHPVGEGNPARVAILEWLDPPILAGLWVPEMIAAAGGTAIGPGAGAPGDRIRWPRLSDERPDLVVVSPCSFDVPRTRRELQGPGLRRSLEELAPRYGTFLADEAYFSRPGPRLADGVELVRHLLSGEPWQPPLPMVPLEAVEVAA